MYIQSNFTEKQPDIILLHYLNIAVRVDNHTVPESECSFDRKSLLKLNYLNLKMNKFVVKLPVNGNCNDCKG